MFEAVEIIDNPHEEPIEVWFEPWGMPHPLSPGQSFRVVADSEQEGQLEVDWARSIVTVYGWPGCTIQVFCGDDLVDDFSIKFPELPPKTITKSFVDFMFGGHGS